jgi:mono/diheme cytochrome c family protein
MHRFRTAATLFLFAITTASAVADPGTDFFEKRVRPVLVQHCYSCHSQEAKKQRGGLLMDSRAALLKGGDSGPSLVPGKPADSLVMKAVRYADPNLKMPPKGKLSDAVIADLEKWVAMGAPDPRVGEMAAIKKGIDLEAARKFWSFQPPRSLPAPSVNNVAWPRSDVDRFLLAKLEAAKLTPAPDAESTTLFRRLSFALTGLPPTSEEIDAFVKDYSRKRLGKRPLTGCSHRRRSGSAGGVTGSTSLAMPTRPAAAGRSCSRTRGVTAITSSTASTTTSRIRSSSASRSPAT